MQREMAGAENGGGQGRRRRDQKGENTPEGLLQFSVKSNANFKIFFRKLWGVVVVFVTHPFYSRTLPE